VEVGAVARRADALQGLAAEAPARIRPYAHDVRRYDEVPALFQTICRDLGGLDLVVYTAGVMPRVEPDEYDFDKDAHIVEVNLLGGIAWLNEAARRFAAAGGGTIVGLSSVAGDRGRRGQPAYGASKAGLSTYLESLRNRLTVKGVRVVTAKPGPVDTPMTHGVEKLPFLISADRAAGLILKAARRGRAVAYVPERWRAIMFVLRQIPAPLFARLNV
jgi:NAD(P)-dependent dehydrogenase (short-subunit alcohol dehydrogenase family)